MKLILFSIGIFYSVLLNAQSNQFFLSPGIDYRQYPIDIEDVPRGGSTNSKGNFYGTRFWQVLSVHCGTGVELKKNWSVLLTGYMRFNHLHWTQGLNLTGTFNPDPERKDKKNFKYDIFLDAEKSIRLKKTKERYMTLKTGIGFSNLNSRYNVFLQDTILGVPAQGYYYTGNLLQFTPRVSLGYQYEKIKASIDAYIIEGPDLNNLTSLWLGATISYEIPIRRKKK